MLDFDKEKKYPTDEYSHIVQHIGTETDHKYEINIEKRDYPIKRNPQRTITSFFIT